MLLFDGHLDLAMDAIDWDRNLELDVHEVRRREAGDTRKGRGCGTLTYPEMREAEVGLCMATVLSRTARPTDLPGYAGVACQEISYARAQGHLAYYRVMERKGAMRVLPDRAALDAHLADWQANGAARSPLGYVLAMEGADPIVWPEQVHDWWADGLRVVGLSHYGVSGYAHGTGTEGGLTDQGRALLREMRAARMVLDLSHLSDPAFWEALERFDGPVLASHNNCRALVPADRQFADEQLQAIFQRDGVIGVALDAWMLYPGWVRGQTTPQESGVTLETLVDHIDHICQLAGNCRHAAIGSDLDGGYGTEQTPTDLDTILDLQRIPDLLRARGYAEADIEAIMHGNWVRLFREALP